MEQQINNESPKMPEAKAIEVSSAQVYVVRNGSEGPEILIGKRSAGGFLDQWSVPGGVIDPGEDVETAALRELEEESGLVLAPDQLQRLEPQVSPTERVKGGVVKSYVYKIQPFLVTLSGDVSPDIRFSGSEFSQMRFVPIAEALQWARDEASGAERLTPVVHAILGQLRAGFVSGEVGVRNIQS